MFTHYFFRAESGPSKPKMQTNVDDNQNDLKVASYMSPSDGSAVSDYPVCNECDRPYSREIGLKNHALLYHIPSALKKCTKCTFKSYSEKHYEQHMEKHNMREITGK